MECDKLKKPLKEKYGGANVKWKPPVADCYKLNVDASFLSSGRGGWGYIARDQDGNYLEEVLGTFREHFLFFMRKPLQPSKP